MRMFDGFTSRCTMPALVVAHDAERSERVRTALQRHHFRVLVVDDVADALAWLDDATVLPSLIIVALDGDDARRRFLLRRLRSSWHGVPVLVMLDAFDAIAHVHGLNVAGVVPTRIGEPELVAAVEAALRPTRAP